MSDDQKNVGDAIDVAPQATASQATASPDLVKRPPNAGKGAVVNKQFRRSMKHVMNAKVLDKEGKPTTRLRKLLAQISERLGRDLENPDATMDWAGMARMMQLIGSTLDKEKYDTTGRGLEGKRENLFPKLEVKPTWGKPQPILMPPEPEDPQ